MEVAFKYNPDSTAINLKMFANNFRSIIKSYVGITASMSLALSICVLFISLMQLVIGERFLKTTSLFVLFVSAPVALMFLERLKFL